MRNHLARLAMAIWCVSGVCVRIPALSWRARGRGGEGHPVRARAVSEASADAVCSTTTTPGIAGFGAAAHCDACATEQRRGMGESLARVPRLKIHMGAAHITLLLITRGWPM